MSLIVYIDYIDYIIDNIDSIKKDLGLDLIEIERSFFVFLNIFLSWKIFGKLKYTFWSLYKLF